jgi:hypothetical protein
VQTLYTPNPAKIAGIRVTRTLMSTIAGLLPAQNEHATLAEDVELNLKGALYPHADGVTGFDIRPLDLKFAP